MDEKRPLNWLISVIDGRTNGQTTRRTDIVVANATLKSWKTNHQSCFQKCFYSSWHGVKKWISTVRRMHGILSPYVISITTLLTPHPQSVTSFMYYPLTDNRHWPSLTFRSDESCTQGPNFQIRPRKPWPDPTWPVNLCDFWDPSRPDPQAY